MGGLYMDYGVKSSYDEERRCWRVKVNGEVDIYNYAAFKEQLIQLTKEVPADLRIDCSDLTYIDSTGLGALVAVLKNVKEFGGTIYLARIQPNIEKLLKITSLNKVFTIGGDDE
jgi:anti-sigma B factor antagonist